MNEWMKLFGWALGLVLCPVGLGVWAVTMFMLGSLADRAREAAMQKKLEGKGGDR